MFVQTFAAQPRMTRFLEEMLADRAVYAFLPFIFCVVARVAESRWKCALVKSNKLTYFGGSVVHMMVELAPDTDVSEWAANAILHNLSECTSISSRHDFMHYLLRNLLLDRPHEVCAPGSLTQAAPCTFPVDVWYSFRLSGRHSSAHLFASSK